MRVLLLGVGMQGKAALHDLIERGSVREVAAADRDIDGLGAHVARRGYGERVRCMPLEASEEASIDRLLRSTPDVAIDLLPASFSPVVAAAAVRRGVHLVNTNYTTPALRALHEPALEKSVTLLPECGMDPGLDLIMLGEAVRRLDRVTGIRSYGAGVPAPEFAADPLRYKVSWTLEGVLRTYRRDAWLIRDGARVHIAGDEIMNPENVHEIDIEGLGRLEAYPNGDALQYCDALGVDESDLEELGRFTLRWPGHCAFWRPLVDLHLLDEAPVTVDGVAVDRVRFLASVLEPHLRYADHERDVAVLRIEVDGLRAGRRVRAVSQVVDRRDLTTGLTAVSRLTGFTASIGAQMIGAGTIAKRGLLSPLTDVPPLDMSEALALRGIGVSFEVQGGE